MDSVRAGGRLDHQEGFRIGQDEGDRGLRRHRLQEPGAVPGQWLERFAHGLPRLVTEVVAGRKIPPSGTWGNLAKCRLSGSPRLAWKRPGTGLNSTPARDGRQSDALSEVAISKPGERDESS